MDVVSGGAVVDGPLPVISAEFDKFLTCLRIPSTSPMDRALKIADAMDWPGAKAALLPRIGDMQGAIAAHRQAIDRPGVNARMMLESLIQMLDREASTTIADARAVRQEWWDRFGAAHVPRQQPDTNDPDPDRPLTVGYVSANFKHSSAGNCLQALVLSHSEAVRAICYSTSTAAHVDPMTHVFRAMADVRDVSTVPEADFAQRVRDDGIDILVDCMGFTYGNRLAAFCERPAPIQITGWGYATGTIPAMDGILLDPITAGADQFFERVVHLPCVITWVPPVFGPDVAPAPTGRVTFGAFHCYIKINPEVLSVWRRILDRVPDARIVFKGKEYGEAELRQRITDVLGVDRCEFWPTTQQMEHFDAFKHIDLVLDPWPQTGGITTCEALYMGVPSVTLAGERTVQRAAAAILAAVDGHDGITTNVEDYVDRAVALVTTERGWLAAQRPYWRERLLQSPICAGYTAAVERVYRNLWRAWCAKEF